MPPGPSIAATRRVRLAHLYTPASQPEDARDLRAQKEADGFFLFPFDLVDDLAAETAVKQR
jgi:hypothetical protein